MSLFDQYTDLLNTEATSPLLSLGASLEPLDRIEAGLADRARRYVMDGTDPQLLLELPRHAEAAHWLGFPGYRLPVFSPARTRVVERARAARHRYFSQALDERVPIEVLERFGRLMQACPIPSREPVPDSGLPEWIYLLLLDGFPCHRSAFNAPFQRSISTLLALVRLSGGGAHETLNLIFERKGMSEFDWHQYEGFLLVDGLDDYLVQERTALAGLAAQLSASGRRVLALHLAAPSRAPAHAALLARLSVDSSKPTREAAGKGLQLIDPSTRLDGLRRIVEGSHASVERVQAVEWLARQPDADALAWMIHARARETQKSVLKALDCALSSNAAATAAQGMPEPPPVAPLVDAPLSVDVLEQLQQNLDELLAAAEAESAREEAAKAAGRQPGGRAAHRLKIYRKLTHADLASLYAKLNGVQPADGWLREGLMQVLQYKDRIGSRPDFGLMQVMRLIRLWSGDRNYSFWSMRPFQLWLERQDPTALRCFDLRHFADALERVAWPIRRLAEVCLEQNFMDLGPCEQLSPERVWPFFATYPEFIEEGLGKRQDESGGTSEGQFLCTVRRSEPPWHRVMAGGWGRLRASVDRWKCRRGD